MKPFKITDLPKDINYQLTQIPSDNAKVCGVPDKTAFNRNEAAEVHYLVVRFASIKRLKLKKTLVKVAEVINQELPEDINTQVEAIKWLQSNWRRF